MILRNLAKYTALSIIIIFGIGCSSPATEEQVLADTTALINNNDAATAEILLKNYLADNNDADNVRMQLGRALAATGKYVEADNQFVRVAIELNSAAFASHLEALFITGDINQIVDMYEKRIGTVALADINGLIYALSKTRQSQNNAALISLASSLPPQSPNSSLIEKLISYTAQFSKDKDTPQYLENLKTVQADSTEGDQNWLYLYTVSNFIYANGEYNQAIDLFKKLQLLRPNYNELRLSIASALVKAERWDEATTSVNNILALSPEHPIGNQLKALIEINNQDLEAAKIHIEKALNSGFETRQNLLIAGDLNFSLQNYEQAISFLERGLSGLPGNTNYHNMLIFAQAASGSNSEQMRTLSTQQIQDLSGLNNVSALIAGLQQRGDTASVNDLLGSIALDDKADPAIRLEFSLLTLNSKTEQSSAQIIKASQDLLRANAQNPDQFNGDQITVAKSVVIGKLIGESKFDEALQTVEEWQRTEPEAMLNALYLAEIYQAQGKHQDTITLLEPLVAQMEVAHAYSLLAIAYNANNQTSDASATIQAGLTRFQQNISLLRQFVSQEIRSNSRNEDFILALYSGSKTDLVKSVTLNMYYAMNGDFVKAKNQLTALDSGVERTFLYWYTLAETNLLLDDTQAALKSLNEAAAIPVLSFEQVTQANNTYERIGDVNAHIAFLQPQVSRYPSNSDLPLVLANLYINNNQASDAEKLLATVTNKSGRFYMLRANASLMQGKFEKANEDFATAFNDYKSENTALAYANFLNNLGETERAINLLNNFYNERPTANNALLFMATLQKGQAAIDNYEKALTIDPNNLIALTNIASELYDLKQYEKALPYAQRAMQIAPDNVEVASVLEKINSAM